MKRLKFEPKLVKLILENKKTTTWRINDNKNLSFKDQVLLCDNSGKEFKKAKIVSVKTKLFSELESEDFIGHESFSSEKEMYDLYSKYYSQEVSPSTELKVIKFELIN